MENRCLLCDGACDRDGARDDEVSYSCPNCGSYVVSGSLDASHDLREALSDPIKRAIVRYRIAGEQRAGDVPRIDFCWLTEVLEKDKLPSLAEQGETAILLIGDETESDPGRYYAAEDSVYEAQIGAVSKDTLLLVLGQLEKNGLIETQHTFKECRCRLTFEGDRMYKDLQQGLASEHVEGRKSGKLEDLKSSGGGVSESLPGKNSARTGSQELDGILRDEVFFCYSRMDEVWLDKLTKMLAPLLRKGMIDVWYDKKIKPGEKWREEIEKALRRAKIGVLLVTSNFFNSDFIQDRELPYLLEASKRVGVRILWVAVDHSMYEATELADIEALNDPSKPLREFKDARRSKAIKQVCVKIVDEYKR